MTNIVAKVGKTKRIRLTYKDGLGNIKPITGATARMVVRKGLYTDPLISKAAVITGTSGEMMFTIDPADTLGLLTNEVKAEYLMGVELTLANGDVIPFLEGDKFILEQSVVR